ncbi:MAG: GNAT family N-acetyltransferase [Calditrichaeota bacterium]|nr:MAG: GNAT family N-acetyltransferase [Calditrichota bacterium]MBL1203842.1 GNAT family N-acetyltransferase [Calditrichota bacterium]NOG43674.1 GNAT family N-acetyltransferase [Calditrichota bacterium]
MQKADKSDIPEIKKLLKDNDLPVADLTNEIDFYIIKENSQVIAAGGLEHAGDYAILRSVVINDIYKGKGLGNDLTRLLIEKAKEENYTALFLLTMTAENYFPRFGFTRIARESAPDSIKNSSEFTTVCPDSAIVMKLDIK